MLMTLLPLVDLCVNHGICPECRKTGEIPSASSNACGDGEATALNAMDLPCDDDTVSHASTVPSAPPFAQVDRATALSAMDWLICRHKRGFVVEERQKSQAASECLADPAPLYETDPFAKGGHFNP